ncbi:MAG: glycosyl hydrolase-related protein [Thermoproteota archaeon]
MVERWVDVSDRTYGFGLLNDCKYGLGVEGNIVRMILVRTSYDLDQRPDLGEDDITYSIYPHDKDWKSAKIFRKGYELNCPLEAAVLISPTEGSMPEKYYFVRIDAENIILSALKKAEDSDELVLRFYETTGTETIANIEFSLDLQIAKEVDLLERGDEHLKLRSHEPELKFEHFEIKTIKLKTS